MEERIITFTADEQGLVKTGGISHYASDTISFIKAVFTLGENWQGFDEVRAVFKSPYVCKNAVLNSVGECYVPFEALMYKGKVRVNLVGSIVTETEVTDRLTTYSVEALDVDEDVPICGEESQPISPSEYEQFVAKVANDANRASQSATDAKTYADEAEASAQNASESASASAVSASDSARSATASAESAQNASESAQSAENAKDDAEDARDEILGMRATAETLEAGSDATASYSDGLLTLGIPRGDQGIQGIQGETGATPNLTIGTVETLEPTEDAYVTRRGTDDNPIFDFGIPKGDKGDPGEVTMSQLSSLLPTDTASGDIASFPDGQSVIPAVSVKVEIEPIQSGSGTPSPDNIRPISGHTECVTEVCGVNILSDGFEVSKRWVDGIYSSSNTNFIASPSMMRCIPNTAYSICFPNMASNLSFYTSYFNANGEFISKTSANNINTTLKHAEFVAPSDANYMAIDCYRSGGYMASEIEKAMVNISSDKNGAYEPYDGETYTTALGRTVYGGTFDVVSGELVVDRAMVTFNGTENWYNVDTSGTDSNRALYVDIDSPTGQYNWNLIGNYITSTEQADSYPQVWKANINPQGNLLIGIPKTITTIAEWKAYLAQNPLQLCYELATPQTINLTPQEIRLLLGTNNVWSDGKVTLTYNADIQRYIEKKLNGNSTTLTMSRPMTAELNETETE